MKVLTDLAQYRGERPVVALGKFDGVHIGHARLLSEAASQARARGVEAMVLTFDRHPLTLLRPEAAPHSLLTFEQKCEHIAALGIDVLIAEPFTRAFADQPAQEYLQRLCTVLRPSAIVAGYNYTFGKDARGSAAMLRAEEKNMHYDFIEIPPVMLEGEPVSSTAIRHLLEAGDIRQAGRMLGYESVAQPEQEERFGG